MCASHCSSAAQVASLSPRAGSRCQMSAPPLHTIQSSSSSCTPASCARTAATRAHGDAHPGQTLNFTTLAGGSMRSITYLSMHALSNRAAWTICTYGSAPQTAQTREGAGPCGFPNYRSNHLRTEGNDTAASRASKCIASWRKPMCAGRPWDTCQSVLQNVSSALSGRARTKTPINNVMPYDIL